MRSSCIFEKSPARRRRLAWMNPSTLIMMAMNCVGYAIGTPVVNLCYDLTGSYSAIFVVFIAIMAVCCIAFNVILSVFKNKKREIIFENQQEAPELPA